MNRFLPLLSFLVALSLGWIFTPAPRGELPKDSLLSSRTLRSGGTDFDNGQRKRVGEIARLKSYDEQVRQVIALASSIPVEDIAEWQRRDLIEGLDGDLETLFFRITSERWLADNPKEFMEWALMMNNHQAGLHLAQWAIEDPAAAKDFLQGRPLSSRAYQISDVVSKMAVSRPDLALQFLEQNLAMARWHDGYHFKSSITSLVEHDLDAVLAARESWPLAARRNAGQVIAGVLLKKDFAQGMSFIESEGLNWKAFNNSSDRELAEVLIENREQLPEGWLSNILQRSSWAFAASKNGLDLLESDPETLGLDSGALAAMATRAAYIPMTGRNPERLMAVINGDTMSSTNRETILRAKILQWDRDDSEGLRKWLGTLDDPELHDIADDALVGFDKKSEPKATVADHIAKVMMGDSLDHTVVRSIARWTPMETDAAISSFQKLSLEEKQASFASLQRVSGNAEHNLGFFKEIFAAAAEFPEAADLNIQTRFDQNFRYFSRNFANVEPANAAEWAAGLPEGSRRQSAIKGVVNSWKQYSPSEAESWIKTLPAEDQVGARAVLETR